MTGVPSRLRVLVVTRNLPPLRGGMERLNLHMLSELAAAFEVAVVGISGCRSAVPEAIAVTEVPVKPLWRFFIGALLHSIGTARRFRPDIVLAGSGLTAPFAWLAARSCTARLAVYVHGLDLVTAHPVYRHGWLPFIRRADLCIANSMNTAGLAMAAGVPGSRVRIVHPGVDMPPMQSTASDFRERFGFGNRPLLLSVGRLVARKGICEFVENALPGIVSAFPDACLIMVGESNPELLSGSSVGLAERIRSAADARGIAQNVRFLGPQPDAVLADAYRAANVHVFPGRDVPGDVEGFGMVAVEAAAHGLQTVAFAVGGIPDAVQDGVSGTLVPAGDYDAYADAVIATLRAGNDETRCNAARVFAERFRWDVFGSRMRELFTALRAP